MDFTPHLPRLQNPDLTSLELIRGSKAVVAMGSRALLTFFCHYPSQLRITGAATTAPDVLRLLSEHKPYVLIATDHLESGCGIDLVVQAKQVHSKLRTLLIATQPQRSYRLKAAMQAGCNGICLESRIGLGTLRAAIGAVHGGGVYIDSDLADLFRQVHADHTPLRPITERETQVLTLVTQGHSNAEIGARLFLSPDTVKSHIQNLRHKLQARDRTHAAVIGLCRGLVPWLDA
ncbi:response regulator transcription factor [Synechococcus sp. CS-1328]|uniref:response regulator transcription factor n=1 Tax=Synechococcus sp. CS-1328 TaxID=2847976 RepID=UPI00223A7834|nr:response regulator transcription factor [Synechococcus sp. CS-1328]MCT0225871.1 response regulator transcription factor [Synechococcus sp. CS-1328]